MKLPPSSPEAALSTRAWKTTVFPAVALSAMAALLLSSALMSQAGESIPSARIAPPLGATDRLAYLAMRDAATSWALVSNPVDGPRLRVLSTADGGGTWRTKVISLAGADARGYSGQGVVTFADALHGWVLLQLSSSPAFSRGALYGTADGGETWIRMPAPPAAGEIAFRSVRDGWIAGGAGGDELYVTRNGGWSWGRVALPAPSSMEGQSYRSTVDLPQFQNDSTGTLKATYDSDSGSTLAVFQTTDGGVSWQLRQNAPAETRPRPDARSTEADRAPEASGGSAFGSCNTPGVATLQAWWQISPYRSAAAYFGGSRRGCQSWNQGTVTASWMAQATAVGWRVVPVWVGPQPGDGIVEDPAAAGRQGMSEAAAAVEAAAAIGLGAGSVLYVEVEGPPDTDVSNLAALRAYVGGWVLRLHAAGYGAGVHGNPYTADTWAGMDYSPDGIWTTAAYDGSACGAMPASAPSGGRRLQQCTSAHDETYGGVTLRVGTHAIAHVAGSISGISVSPVTVMSGQTATVTLTVNAPAPDGGGTADIYTGNAAVFPVPSSFVIPAGQTSGSFNVTAGTVMATTPVTVSADYGNSGMGTSVWVVPVTAAATRAKDPAPAP